jgi:serine/threonine-protein kinase RsbW
VSVRAQRFPARMDAFPALAAFAEIACREAGLGGGDVLRVRLLLEELFTNTVQHGHSGDSDRPIEIALEPTPGKITVVYEDTAPTFDPLASPAASDAADAAAAGRLGLVLVRGMAHELRYERVAGRNRLCFSVRAAGD